MLRFSRAIAGRPRSLEPRAVLAAVLGMAILAGLGLPGRSRAAEPKPGAGSESGSQAPSEPAPPPQIEEIVILGQRDVGIVTKEAVSTTTFDAETIKAFGAQDFSDLAKATPNLQINTLSASTPTFFIRGVGLNDFGANATGAVAIYQDGVPINAPALQLGQMFDVEGAEVRRGPQPFGNERNSSAGMINIASRLPTGDYESSLRFDYGRFDLVDTEGALGLPLTGDGALSTRLAFRFMDRDPFVTNRCGGLAVPTRGVCGASAFSGAEPVPAGLPGDVDGQGRWALRGLLRLQPVGSDADWLLNLHGASIDQDSALGQVIGTGASVLTSSGYVDPAIESIFESTRAAFLAADPSLSAADTRRLAKFPTLKSVTDDIGRARPFANDYNLVGQEELDSFGGSLRGETYLGDVRVKTITGAESYDRSRLTDFDFSPDTAIHSETEDNAYQVTQSLDLESDLERIPLTWRAGGFFLREDLDSNTLFTFNFARTGTQRNQLTRQDYNQQDLSLGVYGNFEWHFHDAFTLSGGVRFNYDKKDFELAVRIPNSPARFEPASTSQVWWAPTGAIVLTYRPIEDLEFYSRYSRGWKPGVFNAAILRNSVVTTTLAPEIKLANPEQIDAFEIGTSSQWFDQTLDLRAAVFYYKYVDYQVFALKNLFGSPPQFEIVNANDAQIYGAEIDLSAEPLQGRVPGPWDQLALELHVSWLESEFLDFTDSRTTFIQNVVVTELLKFTGNRLPNTPRFKVSASVSQPFDLGRYGTITPRYDLTYTDDVFFDPSEGVGTQADLLPKYGVGQKAYVLHNLRLSYRLPGDQIEIAGWVRNLTDERYKTYVAEATSIFSLLNWVGDPRTYGVSVSLEW